MKSDWSGIESFKVKTPGSTSRTDDRYGMFVIPFNPREDVVVVFEVFDGWEHAAVTCVRRYHGRVQYFTPEGIHLQFARGAFWDKDETVVQFHGESHSPHHNGTENHGIYTVHLWGHKEHIFKTPPSKKEDPCSRSNYRDNSHEILKHEA